MFRVVRFAIGFVFAAGAGLLVLASTYALVRAGGADGRTTLAVLAAAGLAFLVAGVRVCVRALRPGAGFLRVAAVAAAVLVVLHAGGYASLSLPRLRVLADSVQQKMQGINESMPAGLRLDARH